jgi:hypothetical protein
MHTLAVNDLEYRGAIGNKDLHVDLKSFTHTFTFGKSYGLTGTPKEIGWAVSMIISGRLEPQRGTIERDSKPYALAQRKKDVWYVRGSQIRRFRLIEQSVIQQIRFGLREYDGQQFKSETEIIERFRLTPERYNRPLRTLSHEAWRASCAIGVANKRDVYCFPFAKQSFVEEFYDLWLKEMIDLLITGGALVLIPTMKTLLIEDLCNEIVFVP